MRGTWFGVYRGFFREKKHAPAKCLSRNLESEIIRVEDFIFNGELEDLWRVGDSVKAVYDDNIHHCGFGDVVREIQYKCSQNVTETDDDGVTTSYEACSFSTIFVKNLMGRSFTSPLQS